MKKILLSATVLCMAASLNAQIVNGNLESWTAGEPDNWVYDYPGVGVYPGTNNYVVLNGEGDPATTTEITGAAAAGGSGSSALLETKDAVGTTLIGQGITQIEGLLLGTWTFSGTPADVSFDFKVAPAAGDTAIVQVVFYDVDTNTVGFTGMGWTDVDVTNTWTPMTLPITYTSGNAITMIEIWAQSSYSADGTPVTGSTLSLDNFMVSGVNGVEEFEFSASVYPNPVNDVLNINLNANASSIAIIGMDGIVVSNETVNSNTTTVDVSGLSSGVYIYQIVSDNGELIRDTFVKK